MPGHPLTTTLFHLLDALNVVKRCIQSKTVVPGGGAIEMEVSRLLREYAKTIAGKQQLVVQAFAKALEVIPQQLCDNAGFDSTDVLNALRKKHSTDLTYAYHLDPWFPYGHSFEYLGSVWFGNQYCLMPDVCGVGFCPTETGLIMVWT